MAVVCLEAHSPEMAFAMKASFSADVRGAHCANERDIGGGRVALEVVSPPGINVATLEKAAAIVVNK